MPRLARWWCSAAVLLAVCVSPQASLAEVPASPQRYALSAKLDAEHHRIDGSARITFTNTSTATLNELVFHLYLNAFRDDQSVFMRESRGAHRGLDAQGVGSIELKTLTIDGEDALSRSERELIPHDFTQLRTSLATPLAPGRSVQIETRFVVTLPPIFVRSGYSPDFFAVAQWFPKLAALESAGHFASFPYYSLGEFYADFADYTLEVDTPADLAVVASGVLVNEKQTGNRIVRQFEAARVHDLAFMAARGFRADVETVDGVLVRYLAPPGYEAALLEHAQVVRAGLAHYGRAFGAYPYPCLSVVIPPREAEGAQGMEYPTLITTGGPWRALPSLPSLSGAMVTAHELAHQWFYGLVANDETLHPVLDEGLSEWASLDLMRHMYGPREGLGPLSVDRFEAVRIVATRLAPSTAEGLAAYEYAPAEYGASVYARASLALESIRRAYGKERFGRALGIYTVSQRFRHATPNDLERAFDVAYGAGFAAHVLRPLLFEGASSEAHLVSVRSELRDEGEDEDETDGAHYLTRVRARRSGAVSLPTWVAAYAADGRQLWRARFPADSNALVLAMKSREPVARIVLDPDRALLLDPYVARHIQQLEAPGAQTAIAQLVAFAQLLASWAGP